MSVGPWQVLLILGVVLLVFGPKRIPGLGKSLGQAIRGFKKGISEDEIDVTEKSKIDSDKENESKDFNMPKKFTVAKFGGTSMANAEAIKRSMAVALAKNANVIVVSATSQTTNQIVSLIEKTQNNSWSECQKLIEDIRVKHLKIAKELEASVVSMDHINAILKELETVARGIFYLKDKSPKALDRILSTGERISSSLMVEAFKNFEKIEKVKYFDARQVIRTDDNFGSALPEIDMIEVLCKEKLIPILKDGNIVITQGFIGQAEDGSTTTLGRGGSDYSAALFAEGISAAELQIWTDVAGVATMDPRVCPKAKALEELSFKEAAELATFGAKVLHPTTLWPAMRKNISVFVGSSMNFEEKGTWIRKSSSDQPLVRAMALRKNQCLLTLTTPRMLHVYGFLAKVFTIFSDNKISVDLVTTSEISIAVTLEDSTLLNKKLIKELSEFAEVNIEENLSLVSIIGNNVNTTCGLSKEIFSELKNINIRMICMGASKHNLCLLVAAEDGIPTVQKLHKKFLE